ncbi:MAG: energy transducer TonB [Candidatus Acidiferrales bacterium]
MKIMAKGIALAIGLLALSAVISVRAQKPAFLNDNEMRLVDYEDLAYPAIGHTARIEGVVVVRAILDDQGKVVDATAISGAEPLVPACLANAKKWRFRPNASKMAVIVYNFRLIDTISKSGCSHFELAPPNFATITTCPVSIQ